MNNPNLVLKVLLRVAPELGLFPCRSKEDVGKFSQFCEKYLRALTSSNKTSPSSLLSRLIVGLSQGKEFVIRRAVQHTFEKHDPSEQDHVCNVCTAIVLHYYNFSQKQHFERLHKLKLSQQSLPIYNYRDQIVEAVQKHQVVIIAGDTGCGKSTQTPQYLLDAGYKKIAVTQPRRIAAISLAKRVAFECLSRHSDLVGYQIRFERTVSKRTRLVFLTEGLLLRQFQSDPQLSTYDLIILDEVHERHIYTDFMLGILLCLCRFRSDLKVVLMSATININLFSRYFDEAPVISVPGRLYPIELHYCPPETSTNQARNRSYKNENEGDGEEGKFHGSGFDPRPYVRILQQIDSKYPANERGDVLLFVSGMSAIAILCRTIQTYADKTGKWVVLPLHSCLSADEQDRVFDPAPEGVRKCIIATNIAETSVTIDGVRFVIDSGKMKEMLHDPKYKLQRLTEFWISQASAEQRKGRAGRTGPGVCFRIYAESDYVAFANYPLAEIQRVSLDSLVLQMIVGNLRYVKKFPFIEPPPELALDASLLYLRQVGAITSDTKTGASTATPLGELLSQLPVDIIVGRLLVLGSLFGLTDPVLSVAAGLSVQSIFASGRQLLGLSELASSTTSSDLAAHDSDALLSEDGDLITLLQVYEAWCHVKRSPTSGSSKKWCQRRGVEEQRLYDISKLRSQFYEVLMNQNLLEDDRRRGGTGDNQEEKASSTQQDRRALSKLRKRTLYEDMMTSKSKRKILRVEGGLGMVMDLDDNPDEGDEIHSKIRDLEFRLAQDMGRRGSSSTTDIIRRKTAQLKIVLAAGLYPQVAVPDESNSVKSEGSNSSELVFHTRNKNFLLIHPSSIFYRKPGFLQPSGRKFVTKGRHLMSASHQMIAFTTLLETNKPYLLNCMQVPAVQLLLLCSSSIDTNQDCSKILFDSWLEVTFSKPSDGESLVRMAVHLRSAWDKLLQYKLKHLRRAVDADVDGEKEDEDNKQLASVESEDDEELVARLERELPACLTDFVDLQPVYAFRRVFTAELPHLYIAGNSVSDTPDEEATEGQEPSAKIPAFAETFTVLGQKSFAPLKELSAHPTKGGQVVTEYLVYNCLRMDETDADAWTEALSRVWTCSRCEKTLVVTTGERLRHEATCSTSVSGATTEAKTLKSTSEVKAGSKEYFCDVCQKNLLLTPSDFLRHKLQHSDTSS